MEFGMTSDASRQAAADGVGVAKKRRRPALACEQCRRRKIKCDRTTPCGPCRRSSLESCTYRPECFKGPGVVTATSSTATQDSAALLLALASPVSDWQRQLPAEVPPPAIERPRSSAASDVSESVDLQPHTHSNRRMTLDEATGTVEPQRRTLAPIRGCFVKSRFYGPSHFINSSGEFQYILDVQRAAETDKNSEIQSLLKECKRLCRVCKSLPYLRGPANPSTATSLADDLPPQRTCDELVRLHLRTFESVHRILHVPTFRVQYASFWANPRAASPGFTAQLLLIAALGSCFYHELETSRWSLRASALRWISNAQAWLSSPSEKSRLNIMGLQTHCLLLLAKQAYPGGPELVWISAGSLLRAAMQLGLHHDPAKLPDLSGFEAEMRRRLWATILDLQIQASIESGGSPLISQRDYDCEPPSNIDDSQLVDGPDGGRLPPPSKPITIFTDTSMQCALMRTLPIRLEVAKYLNDFSSEQSYDETLRQGQRMRTVLEENMRLFKSFGGQHQQPTPFQIKLFELLTYRFLLALHFPYAIRARKNPKYYFSHKVCLDLSLSLLHYNTTGATVDPLAANSLAVEDDYTRLRVLGGGLFRDCPLRAIIFVCIELLMQLEDDQGHHFAPSTYTSLGRQELYKVVTEYVKLLAKRIEAGETTVRGHVFFSSVLAHFDALQAGRPSKHDILAAMRKSLEFCQSMLKAMSQEYYPSAAGSGGNNLLLDSVMQQASESSTTASTESGLLDNTAWFDFVSFISTHPCHFGCGLTGWLC
ncbi:uncharacterized protein B0H64DRAFT_73345 [Chaetomium fimeti]|uniref:Zn(2)-C6 fungal-type domain-containing protein n=1 Tax=Chaetomium fimeti TaxID=1854472 RepID=A0AAE0HKR8_9PEZI|nr:hypothetical protein B0H64DRAFT_73345 [Chaetomium fimeti]